MLTEEVNLRIKISSTQMTFEDTGVSQLFENNNLSTNRQYSATFHK
jgi:hypothetical protein